MDGLWWCLEDKDEQSSNRPSCPRKVPLPSESTTEPFGCHNIFRKAVFPLWPIVIFVTCHNSLPPPPPRAPTPTPGVAHKLDPSLSFLCFYNNSVFVPICLHKRHGDETGCQLTLCSL